MSNCTVDATSTVYENDASSILHSDPTCCPYSTLELPNYGVRIGYAALLRCAVQCVRGREEHGGSGLVVANYTVVHRVAYRRGAPRNAHSDFSRRFTPESVSMARCDHYQRLLARVMPTFNLHDRLRQNAVVRHETGRTVCLVLFLFWNADDGDDESALASILVREFAVVSCGTCRHIVICNAINIATRPILCCRCGDVLEPAS